VLLLHQLVIQITEQATAKGAVPKTLREAKQHMQNTLNQMLQSRKR
jgi:hypothetical protein